MSLESGTPSPSVSASPMFITANWPIILCIVALGWALSKNRYSSTFDTTFAPLPQIGRGTNGTVAPPEHAWSCVFVIPTWSALFTISLKIDQASIKVISIPNVFVKLLTS